MRRVDPAEEALAPSMLAKLSICLDAIVADGRLRHMQDSFPENVVWFVQQLESSGFVETDRAGGTMDSGVIAFRREPVEVRLVKDRSQWSVDLIADGWPERDRLTFPLLHGFALD